MARQAAGRIEAARATFTTRDPIRRLPRRADRQRRTLKLRHGQARLICRRIGPPEGTTQHRPACRY
jgi:hypothetical protein